MKTTCSRLRSTKEAGAQEYGLKGEKWSLCQGFSMAGVPYGKDHCGRVTYVAHYYRVPLRQGITRQGHYGRVSQWQEPPGSGSLWQGFPVARVTTAGSSGH
eukprot:1099077-Pelagomonas_calceolata.AAC.1